MSTENRLVEGLRRAGARMTAQRLAICEYLDGNTGHPTVSDVYEALRAQFPTMSLATVYNTLRLLVELDLVHEAATAPDGSTRYDPDTEPHLNLICTSCHRIVDVHELDLSQIDRLSSAQGFQVADINIAVHGLCSICQQRLNVMERN